MPFKVHRRRTGLVFASFADSKTGKNPRKAAFFLSTTTTVFFGFAVLCFYVSAKHRPTTAWHENLNPGNPAVFRFKAPRRTPTTRFRDEVSGVEARGSKPQRTSQRTKQQTQNRPTRLQCAEAAFAECLHPTSKWPSQRQGLRPASVIRTHLRSEIPTRRTPSSSSSMYNPPTGPEREQRAEF